MFSLNHSDDDKSLTLEAQGLLNAIVDTVADLMESRRVSLMVVDENSNKLAARQTH